LSALTGLVEDGRVNYLGASTMAAWQLTKALWKADSNDYQRFDVVQPLFHAGYYKDVEDYLSVAADQELAVCPYSPLAGGFLTGKYTREDPDDPKSVQAPDGSRASFDDRFERFYLSERGWKVLDEIRAVADEVDATPAQVSLRWLMDQDAFTCVPIIGARTVAQLEEDVAAAEVSPTTNTTASPTPGSTRTACGGATERRSDHERLATSDVGANAANDIVDIEGIIGLVEYDLAVDTDDEHAVVAHHQ